VLQLQQSGSRWKTLADRTTGNAASGSN
jgi:hypothetical protein